MNRDVIIDQSADPRNRYLSDRLISGTNIEDLGVLEDTYTQSVIMMILMPTVAMATFLYTDTGAMPHNDFVS